MDIKFNKLDYGRWTEFRLGTSKHLSTDEFRLVCELHATYYKHRFYKPCTCSPKKIKKWINDLNAIWNNGN